MAKSGHGLSLVTGGTGFIGRCLVDALLAEGKRVRVLGRRPVARWRRSGVVEHLRGDISQPDVIERAIEGVSAVYHLAAATDGDAEYYERVTVQGSERLLRAFAEQGGGRVVFVSSISVYDAGALQDDVVVDENFPLERNPIDRGLYARSKLEADLIAQSFLSHRTVKVTVVRPGLVYGSGTKNLLNGAAWSLKGKVWLTLGAGKRRLPLIYVEDLARIIIKLSCNVAAIGGIYNVIHPDQPTTNEFIDTYRRLSGDRRPVVKLPIRRVVPVLAVIDRLVSATSRKSSYAQAATRLTRKATFVGTRLVRELAIEPRVGWREGLKLSCGVDA